MLTERAGETVMSLAARSRHVDVLMELDDLTGADIAIETLQRLARDARDRRAAAFVPLHRARRAALDGRYEDAERCSPRSPRSSASFGLDDPDPGSPRSASC